jgi:phosphoglycerol transferase MdoB-like AlkP superfamily enzyme
VSNFNKNIFNTSWLKILAIFIFLSFSLRLILAVQYFNEITISSTEIIKVLLIGLFFDSLTVCYFAILPLIYFILLPQKIFNHKKHQIFLAIIYFIFINIIIFSIFSEIVFFEEFNARFNFIAVDYLIYTTEVIANIVESYPMGILLSIILIISSLIFYFSYRRIVQIKIVNFKNRLKFFAIILAILLIEFFVIDVTKIDKFFDNNYNKELSQNGIYQLFSAYRNNQIDYDKFYTINDSTIAENRLRDLISKQEPSAKFVDDRGIERFISAQKNQKEQKYNIIFIAIESMNADFMAYFGNQKNLTPNLDEISKKGLFFTNLKATGTRTVRGLEALILATPPTPGNSIVRRPNNENLFNIATPLKQRGYDAKFIYGGDGYFDNMNYFFFNNGFETIDRPQFSKNEISFSNAWGVADEDLFDKTIAEADKSYAKGKNFLNFVMTTSNHRPFTYPENKIDIPSKTNRDGAVKYSDYAIGQLIKKSQQKPWFDNTIFVFVADHCAGSAGNSNVPLWRYQIPAIFYAPKIIKPQIYAENSSQIDIAPTLLGFLNLSYKSKFFGVNVLDGDKKYISRAFVSTYSDLGYFADNKLFLLKLKKQQKIYDVELNSFGYQGSKEILTTNFSEEKLLNAQDYYQIASDYFKNGNLKQESFLNK